MCQRLKDKGFASINIVLGIGSFQMTYTTRDQYGFAMKATYAEIGGQSKDIFKDPETDTDKMKKSLKGLLKVYHDNEIIKVKDGVSKEDEDSGLLKTVFLNGKLIKETSLKEIRELLKS
jgi:nicotinamide phosphoribosyltransferase